MPVAQYFKNQAVVASEEIVIRVGQTGGVTRIFFISREDAVTYSTYFKTNISRSAHEHSVTFTNPALFALYDKWLSREPSDPIFPIIPNEPMPPTFGISHLSVTKPSSAQWVAQSARYILDAYWLGEKLGSPHFQDGIMNEIVEYFRPDVALQPELIEEVFSHVVNGLTVNNGPETGLRRFLVDYYIWSVYYRNLEVLAQSSDGHFTMLTKPLNAFPPRFIEAVTNEIKLHHKPEGNFFAREVEKNSEAWVGMRHQVPDFNRLRIWLKNKITGEAGEEAEEKCRYHTHGMNEACLNKII